jgi:DNA repair protein RadC
MAFSMPREKMEKFGVSGLTDVDLIAVLLGSGIKESNYMSIARKVFKLISSQRDMSVSVYRRLQRISGIGRVKAMQISSAIELGRRLFGSDSEVYVRNREDVLKLVESLKKKKQEYAVVLYLDARNRLIKRKTVAMGSSNMLVVEPREVFESALKYHATSIILVHNHPSGDTRPSKADLEFTKRVTNAGKMLGIEVLDHVIT